MKIKTRTLIIAAVDYLTSFAAYLFFAVIMREFLHPNLRLAERMLIVACVLLINPLFHKLFGVYRIIHRYAQAKEYLHFGISFFVTGCIDAVLIRTISTLFKVPMYRFLVLMALAFAASAAMIGTRLVYQTFVKEREAGKASVPKGKRTLIVGCGEACLLLLNEVKAHPESGILPLVCVDNDGAKVGRSIAGVRIEGTDADIPALCKKYDIERIIVAIPSADNALRAQIIAACEGTDAEIKMLPRVSDFGDNSGSVVAKMRDFTMEELLGREPIEVDKAEIRDFINGKTVLITGGGGSIGSELCRQIARNKPKKLVIVDIYENNAYDIEQELRYQYGDELNLVTLIASVRDYERIENIMLTHKPDLVIHAAAHKHVPLMENAPQEAVKNNVFGTYNTARAAIKAGVPRFILISTDKAVNPTNIMGASKRMCEMVIQSLGDRGTVFSAVRFGNVLGSNGSVIPLFKKQIASGGPVTVTHPDIIRFFMTIPEAVQLVLLAGAKAKGGEIFVLNMGSPVKIAELAKRIITLSGKKPGVDIEIKYTGLRPGEKLYEELMMEDEHLQKTESDKIFIGHFVDFDKDNLFAELEKLKAVANDNTLSAKEMRAALETEITRLVPTYHHPVSE